MNIEIIGTSHISQQSISEIKRAIANKPDIVAIELDKPRFAALFEQHKKLSMKDLPKIGLFGYLFVRIGTFVQQWLGKKVGTAPGADMKTAILGARKVGARVALIDQDIRVTISKLSKSMSFLDKLKLGLYLLFGGLLSKHHRVLRKIDLRKVPPEEVIEQMLGEIKLRFPALYKALITDRNTYMIKQIRAIQKHFPNKSILVVVGAGHKRELSKLLSK